MNMENCIEPNHMTAEELGNAIRLTAGKIKGPAGVGIWDGNITGTHSGITHGPQLVAVFGGGRLIAPFGPMDNSESEACAVLFTVVLNHAEMLADALTKQHHSHTGSQLRRAK